MNGEYEMCACGHFRKDHAQSIDGTVRNCGCGCPEFRKKIKFADTRKFIFYFSIVLLN